MADPLPHEDLAYLFTFRLLLERLSWIAEGHLTTLAYTLAHVRRFRLAKLRQYEAKLRAIEATIKWSYLDPHGGRLSRDDAAAGRHRSVCDSGCL
jgi:hypothetical protein